MPVRIHRVCTGDNNIGDRCNNDVLPNDAEGGYKVGDAGSSPEGDGLSADGACAEGDNWGDGCLAADHGPVDGCSREDVWPEAASPAVWYCREDAVRAGRAVAKQDEWVAPKDDWTVPERT